MRRAAKKDLNHNDIAGYLRSLGWSVLDLSTAGNGIPDLAVGKPGFAAIVEVKQTVKHKLTPKEQAIRDRWEGPYLVVTSPQDAEEQLNALYGRD